MCAASQQFNPTSRLLGQKFKYADPLMARVERLDREKVAGAFTPKMPTPPTPTTPPQAAKAPDSTSRRRQGQAPRGPTLAGTLLTGPSGVDNSSLNIGRNTLLGG